MNGWGASHLSHTKTSPAGNTRSAPVGGVQPQNILQGEPGASVLLMKRCVLLGAPSVPSLSPLLLPLST